MRRVKDSCFRQVSALVQRGHVLISLLKSPWPLGAVHSNLKFVFNFKLKLLDTPDRSSVSPVHQVQVATGPVTVTANALRFKLVAAGAASGLPVAGGLANVPPAGAGLPPCGCGPLQPDFESERHDYPEARPGVCQTPCWELGSCGLLTTGPLA